MALPSGTADLDVTEAQIAGQRASLLRSLARQLDGADLHTVARAAGCGVWEGPAADDCREHLVLYSQVLRLHAEHLRLAATQLERLAAGG